MCEINLQFLHVQASNKMKKIESELRNEQQRFDRSAAETRTYKLCGSKQERKNPIDAALEYMEIQHSGWRNFSAKQSYFPSILYPNVTYDYDETTKQLKTRVTDVNEAENNTYNAIAEAFRNQDVKPIMIHSLQGSIFAENTAEGFRLYEYAIDKACRAGKCDKSYFFNKKFKEVVDVALLGSKSICLLEVNDNEGDSDLQKAIENKIDQLNSKVAWWKNLFNVAQVFCEAPEICETLNTVKFVALPNCPRKNLEDLPELFFPWLFDRLVSQYYARMNSKIPAI